MDRCWVKVGPVSLTLAWYDKLLRQRLLLADILWNAVTSPETVLKGNSVKRKLHDNVYNNPSILETRLQINFYLGCVNLTSKHKTFV